MLRLNEDAELYILGQDAVIERPNQPALKIIGQRERLIILWECMKKPRSETWLRIRLALHPTEEGHSSINDLVSFLIEEDVLVHWELGTQLVELHLRTTQGGEFPMFSPELETGRVLRESDASNVIQLPEPRRPLMALAEALLARHTIRHFVPNSMPLDDFATILGLGFGTAKSSPIPLVHGAPASGRTYPSGGALYPIELVVYPLNVENLDQGFYYYQPLPHRIAKWSEALSSATLMTFLNGQNVESANLLCLFFIDFTRVSFGKYGEKIYRLALLEAGHVAQNLLLIAGALGFFGVPLCGYDDALLSKAAHLEFPYEVVIYILCLGKPHHEDSDKQV